MNPTLMDYILNVLAPKEYRLEFKNRLENLCSLSGTPMSPGLSKWLTKTFGLEMTRVVQDYSSFSSPKFSPELQERINKIVPSNYQGYDANQGLNQLFDVSCCDNFYVLSFNDPTWSSFSGWILNGYPDYDWGSLAASVGGSYVLDFAGLAPPFSPPSQATFIYQGPVPPPDLIGTDAFSNPVSYSWTKICQNSVWQMTYSFINSPTISTIQIGPIDIDLLYYGGPTTLSAFDTQTTESAITAALQVYFGPSAYCVINYTPGTGAYVVDYFNIYANSVNMNNACSGQTKYNSSEFDLANISLRFSNIYVDTLSSEWKYGTQLISTTCPSGFILGYKVDFPTAPGVFFKSNATELIANGTVSTLDPSIDFGMASLQTGNYIQTLNGEYVSITSVGDPSPYSDNIKILNPYDGYNQIWVVQTDCIV